MNTLHLIAALLLVAAALSVRHSAADAMPLPVESGLWEKKVFPIPGVSDEEAAALAIEDDPEKGPCLAVGPWRAARWSTRFEFSKPFPFTQATIRGWYRTEDCGPYCGEVRLTYLGGEQRVAARHFALAPAPEWTPFEFTFRVPPPTADSVQPAFGLSRKTEGRILFAGLTIDLDPTPLAFPETPAEATRPAPPTDFEQGPFFRLEERDGTWWLVAPDGRAFYSVGTDVPGIKEGQRGEGKGREYAAFMRSVGFNSLAGWSDIRGWTPLNDALAAEGQRPFAATACLESAFWRDDFDRLLDAEGRTSGEGHAFPDPFDPRFEQAYRARAERLARVVRDKPWFVGYFADNELSHRDLFRFVYSPHCSAAFARFLADRRGDIAALNEAWGTDFASFEDLIARRPDPTLARGPMYEDFALFEREIVKRYVEVTIRAIRDADPNHLVFSNRLMLGDIGSWQSLVDLYRPYDAIAVNLYPMNQTPGLSDLERSVYHMVHEKTGRPVIVGEWSVPAADSGLYDNPDKLDWSWNEVVQTQTQRARQAACVALDFYNMPFVIGAHWFIWSDFDSEKRQANRGLFDASGRPWQELIDALTNAHRRIGLPVPYR